MDIRNKPVHTFTNNLVLERSISLMQQKVASQSAKLSRAQQKYRSKINAKLSNEGGIDVPINDASNLLFNENTLPHLKEFLSKEVSQDSLADYIFQESIKKHTTARISGKGQVRHCPIVFRLAIQIRRRMCYSGGLYDFLATALGLPKDTALRQYMIPNSDEQDGMMIDNIINAQIMFDQKNIHSHAMAWERHVFYVFSKTGKLMLVATMKNILLTNATKI